MADSILGILKTSTIQIISLFGLLIFTGLILGFLERWSSVLRYKALGMKSIYLTAFIGVPVHEIGHLIMAKIFCHRITKVRFFQFSKKGTLGKVDSSYSKKNPYQRLGLFFIALGPIFSGIGAIVLFMYLLLPGLYTKFIEHLRGLEELGFKAFSDSFVFLLEIIFSSDNIGSLSFWIFIFLAVSVSSHIALSRADMKGAFQGLVFIYTLFFVSNLILLLLGLDSQSFLSKVSQYNLSLILFSFLAIIFSSLSFSFSAFFYLLKKISK
jgi:hypothetical protein